MTARCSCCTPGASSGTTRSQTPSVCRSARSGRASTARAGRSARLSPAQLLPPRRPRMDEHQALREFRADVPAPDAFARERARAELLAVVEPSRRRRLTRGRVAALVVAATTLAIALALVPARFGGDQRDDALAGLPSGPILHAILEVPV